MQAPTGPPTGLPENRPYTGRVPRKLQKPRPPQGARLAALRQQAGLSQTELARLVGEPQQNIAQWEQSEKPPRADAIPKIAQALGVRIEDLVATKAPAPRRSGPAGKVRKLFDEVSKLPRRQQDKIVEFLSPIVEEYKKKRTG
jgi:transcriptional regulator with XRE-family HTH domain